ncbi:MAG TPA: NAD(P)H-hydrate epimerase, partial [Methylocella sp.]|nr:NAD(P)H-hydrate epimerase [Methylocella sp.]
MSQTQPAVLLCNTEMAEADRLTIAGGVAGITLMEAAGAAVFWEAIKLVPKESIAVFCGPGNNGGDGFVAARLLAEQGYAVTVGLLGARGNLHGDASLAAACYTGPIVPIETLDLEAADLAIDALFGAGLARDLDGAAKAAVLRLNEWSARTKKPVIAVDVPSGIDGSSGQVRGAAVEARKTVTFFRRKPGHVLLPGRLYCGRTVVADIGIKPEVLDQIGPKTFVNDPALWRNDFPIPRIDGHKYTRGHALVLSGGLAHTGAARLAARGALRMGAGLVTIATPREALVAHAAALTAIMTRLCDGPDELAALLDDPRKNAIVLGPALGVGGAARALVETALAASQADAPARAIVLDADALTSFAGDAGHLAGLIRASGKAVVLTPHDGEYTRLFTPPSRAEDEGWARLLPKEELASRLAGLQSASKLERARAAARLTDATVLLKGPDTVVAHPDGQASI